MSEIKRTTQCSTSLPTRTPPASRREPQVRYPKPLRHIPRVTPSQVRFGKKLDLDLRGCTVSVAEARIDDVIESEFYDRLDPRRPTPKQIAFAAKFGYDIAQLSRREADAVVDDLMTELNRETMEAEQLSPGVPVTNIHDSRETVYVIPSIKEDGTVYLKGGEGRKAWARSLRRYIADEAPGA